MTLFDWDVKVRPHLQYIEAGAEMAARHAEQLPCKPDFATRSQEELATARAALEAALQSITEAQAQYASKPRESDHAA